MPDEPVSQEATPEVATTPSSDDFDFLNAPLDPLDSPPVKETASTPAETPAAPTHPRALVNAALKLGFQESNLGAISTDVLTDLVLSAQEKREAEFAQVRQRRQPQEPVKPAAPVEVDVLDQLEEQGFDKNLIAGLRTKFKKYDEIAEAVTQRAQVDHQSRVNEGIEAIEDSIERLGEQFVPLLGKGRMDEITQNEKQLRADIYAAARIDENRDSPRTQARKYEQAARRILGSVVKAAPKPAVARAPNGQYTADEWKKGSQPPPSATAKPQLKNGERAAQLAAREYMLTNDLDGARRDEFDGIPEN